MWKGLLVKYKKYWPRLRRSWILRSFRDTPRPSRKTLSKSRRHLETRRTIPEPSSLCRHCGLRDCRWQTCVALTWTQPPYPVTSDCPKATWTFCPFLLRLWTKTRIQMSGQTSNLWNRLSWVPNCGWPCILYGWPDCLIFFPSSRYFEIDSKHWEKMICKKNNLSS